MWFKIKKNEDKDGLPILTRFTAIRNSMRFTNKNINCGFQNGLVHNKSKEFTLSEFDNLGFSDTIECEDKTVISNGLFPSLISNDSSRLCPVDNKLVKKLSFKDDFVDVSQITSVHPSLAWTLTGRVYNQGPDQILPSIAVSTFDPQGAVRILELDHPISKRKPISIPSLLIQAVERAPDHTALAVKREGQWEKWSYRQYLEEVRAVAKAFIALGLERYHSVCILGFNSPEWFISDLAAVFAGGIVAGIYTTNSAEACVFCAIDSKANIFVVEDEKQLAKVLEIKDQLPHLKTIVQYSGQSKVEGVWSWDKLIQLGNDQSDKLLEERLSLIAINQCCALIYTSGTMGNPKGVMLSHDNLTWISYANTQRCDFRDCKEEYISYLPLSHVAAKVADIYCSISTCATIYFADKDALKGSLLTTMQEVRPTKFFAVPRVWEKMYEKMQEVGRTTKGVKKILGDFAKRKGLEYNTNRMNGINSKSIGFWIANKLILSKVRTALGFDRCTLHLSGAAPISQDILKYFMSLNIVVTEIYGMSECSGPHCMSIDSAFRLGSCGTTIPGCVTKIHEPDADGNGEILMGGRHVSMGYLHQPEKTLASIDLKGWLHSEDVGQERDGFLYITGRLKEILITAGGENVAPIPIEDRVKGQLPIVSQAMVLGDRLKFLSILLTLKTEVDKETQEPWNTLLPYTRQWISQHGGCDVTTVQEVLDQLHVHKNEKLRKAIQTGINEANLKAPSQAQRIQKWHILPTDFSIPGGELGPTLKLKRQTVYNKYKKVIDELYINC